MRGHLSLSSNRGEEVLFRQLTITSRCVNKCLQTIVGRGVEMQTTKVLIVGAGPTGLALCAELARQGVDALIHFISRWEGPDAGTELPALLRIAVTHPRGRDQLVDIFREQLAPAVDKPVSAERAPLCSALIATQAIGLAFTRYVIELPVVVALSATQLVEHIRATFQGYLDVH